MRGTCRYELHDDPRPALKAAGRPYVFAILHATQVAAGVGSERGTGAMVSRSVDGDLIASALKSLGVVVFRGSSRKNGVEKGGKQALHQMADHVRSGMPAIIAVDGPRGPRGKVKKGIAWLAKETDAVVLTVVAVPSRRWVFGKTWDRFQCPQPWSRVDGYFGAPLEAAPGESVEAFRMRIEATLNELEHRCDPQQAMAA
ncbi:hypothetical protein Mal64_11790 [Pseudobythopirellula maris]|uniref:DUF374 domain-containing protein n=2 Tax=Pseudobythopirellula maris TaxID=2527991 RepID=A0A5C5ZTF7_9BACT|nr:hypothetical protein Mal64_11790 [Pseudobythopirellula maris]